jgi:hypothetical protein
MNGELQGTMAPNWTLLLTQVDAGIEDDVHIAR